MNSYKKKNASLITIEGHLEHITYFNEETQYTIARLKTPHAAAGVTVVGYLAGVSPGETLKVKGAWQTHPKYGQQFKIYSYEVTLPAAVEGIRTYLASSIIKGIGPSLAARLVAAFGGQTL
jgi:exodeoxyribonuclease V alpha subunit